MVVVFEQFAKKQNFRPVPTTDHYFDPVGLQQITSKQESIFCKPVKWDWPTMLCGGTAGTKHRLSSSSIFLKTEN